MRTREDREWIIFRHEYDPYMKIWGYLAIFPDDPANNGKVACVRFYQNGDSWWKESFGEASYSYLYKCKIIHKNDPIIPELLKVIEDYYGGSYEVVEKIIRRK